MNARHPIRGFLVGPLVAPLGYWGGTIANAWAGGLRFDWSEALRELVTIAAFGLPIAYAAAFVWGAPVLYLLHRLGWLRPSTVIVTGALGGALVSVWFAFAQRGAFIRVPLSVPGAAVLGALAGGTCWWMGRGDSR